MALDSGGGGGGGSNPFVAFMVCAADLGIVFGRT